MATQWPLVVNKLVTLLPTLSGWTNVTVYDGAPVTGDIPVDYATVGYVADDQAGTYNLIQDPDGVQWQEAGTVRSQLTCVTGDADLSTMRTRTFALVDALETYVRNNRTLGNTLSPEGTTELTVEVLSIQSGTGAGQTVIFTLQYFTVT